MAAEICKTGFGDCKGLTNYMKAMLKAVGINSYFTIIHLGGQKSFNRAYPSPSQANHVILTVPVSGDTIRNVPVNICLSDMFMTILPDMMH